MYQRNLALVPNVIFVLARLAGEVEISGAIQGRGLRGLWNTLIRCAHLRAYLPERPAGREKGIETAV